MFIIGINSIAFVTDMSPNFSKFSNDVNVSFTIPFFFLLNNKKVIYNIFDPPHVLKATRNMFFQRDFKYEN